MQSKKTIQCLADLPVMPTTLDTMAWNKTGAWRFLTPVARNKIPPCRQGCPAGTPVPDFINALKQNGENGALEIILAHNPLPGLTGRLCYHPCQTKCVRRDLDEGVSIQRIERYLADCGDFQPPAADPGKAGCVTVVGAGPLGLSCAYFLGLQGVTVKVTDAGTRAGGALLDIAPEKLDPGVLEKEIDRLVAAGRLELSLGTETPAAALAEMADQSDMVILDPTAGNGAVAAPESAVSFNPFDDEAPAGNVVAPTLPDNLIPFKAPMIAHYIGAGRRVARLVAACLSGESFASQEAANSPDQPVTAEQIRLDRFRAEQSAETSPRKRQVEWTREQVMAAADRCLSCGTCNLCEQCVISCPDTSILKNPAGTGVCVDLYHCKGCGICAYECPRGVITMEEINE